MGETRPLPYDTPIFFIYEAERYRKKMERKERRGSPFYRDHVRKGESYEDRSFQYSPAFRLLLTMRFLCRDPNWYSVGEITCRFKDTWFPNAGWVNEKSVGRELSRLGFYEKKRINGHIYYYLDRELINDKILNFSKLSRWPVGNNGLKRIVDSLDQRLAEHPIE
jgi:hypothetical protein